MKKIYVLFLISFYAYAQFDSLSDVVSYANNKPEYPSIDNDDWKKPDFISFYEAEKTSIFSRLLGYIGLGSKTWSPQEFEHLLREATHVREGWGMQGHFVQKIMPESEGKLIILGDVQGAFHSFVRDLQELVRMRLLSDELKISNGNYLILNGNTIDSSAYNAETLLLVLLLVQKNPKQFIYVRGKNETLKEGQDLELFKQLRNRLGTRHHALFKLIPDFFDTLPSALYVMRSSGQGLKISATEDGIDDALVASFLSSDVEMPIMHLSQAQKGDKRVFIDANIKASNLSRTFGLSRYAGPPLTWTVLSSPTGINRRLYAFFNDAFAIVQTASRFNNWTITLYHQDVRKKDGFDASGTYNLSTGSLVSGAPLNFFDDEVLKKLEQEIAQKKETLQELSNICKEKGESGDKVSIAKKDGQQKKLVLGTSLDLSKSMKEWGKKVKETLSTVFELQNKKGEANGNLFQLIFLDDGYTPDKARENYKKFIDEFDVKIILVALGTPTTQTSLEFVKAGKLILLFPATESSVFRKPDLKNVVNLSRSYFDQGKALIDYIFKSHENLNVVALFYQDDAFGKDGLNGAKEALKKYNVKKVVELPYARNQKGYAEQRSIIEKEKPDVIGMFAVPTAVKELMRGLPTKFLSERILFGISDLGAAEVQAYFKDKGLKVIHSSAFPDVNRSDLALVEEFREFARQHNLTIGPFAFEAYADAQLFLYILDQIEGDVTTEKIIEVAQNIKELDFKGLRLDFDPETRTLLDALWISKGDDSEWTKIVLEQPKEVEVRQKAIEEIPKKELANEIKESEKMLQRDEKPSIIIQEDKIILGNEQGQVSKKNIPMPDEEIEVKDAERKPALLSSDLAVHGDTIVIGNTSDFNKGLKAMSDALKLGIDLKLQEINRKGGVKGKKIQISYLDDGYIPKKARENVGTFLNNVKTDILMASVGTPTLESYIDLVKNGQVTALFPFSGSSTFRAPEFKHMIHYRPSYDQNIAEITEYIIKAFSSKRFALFYQNDTFGIIPKDAALKVLKKHGITDIVEVPFERNDLNFKEQAKIIEEFNPGVIGFFGPSIAAQGLIRQMSARKLADKRMYGLSWLTGEVLQNFLKGKGLKMIIPNLVPDPKTSEIPIAKEFRQAAKKAGVPLYANAFEGYVNGALLVYLLEQIEGEVTADKLIKAAENIKNVDFNGIKLNFDPKSRVLSHQSWIDFGTGEDWKHVEFTPSDKQ